MSRIKTGSTTRIEEVDGKMRITAHLRLEELPELGTTGRERLGAVRVSAGHHRHVRINLQTKKERPRKREVSSRAMQV